MKELSTEEKAKRYDEAIKRAKEYDFSLTGVCVGDIIEDVFPELKESEDEKIRKMLIKYIKDQQSTFISAPDCRDKYEEEENNKYNSWIDWLEKQGDIDRRIQEEIKKQTKQQWNAEKQGKQNPAWSKDDIMNSVIKDKESAIKFLKSAGIMNENGELAEEYRLEKQDIDISLFSNEQRKYMEKYISLDKVTLIKLLAERDRNVEETTKPFENLDENASTWSEEDEETIKFLIAHFCVSHANRSFQFTSNKCITHDELLEKIRNLRLKLAWKPSESDILLLEWIANGQANPKDFQVSLGGLIGQLKKLRER